MEKALKVAAARRNVIPFQEPQPKNREGKPVYSRTRVMAVDPKWLRRNKIVSLWHDDTVTDQIKILRTQVLGRMKKMGSNTMLITSAHPSEGKTLVALNLAVSISQEMGRTVLLVEADMRNASLDCYLGLDTEKGLSNILLDEAEVPETLINPGIDKLVVLPAGRPTKASAELLGSPRMESLVRELKDRYPDRFIIFDGPSLLSFADPLAFSQFIESILLVVEGHRTTKKDLAQALELLEGQTLIGAIYNKDR
jgi:non-specific protein-tyrosine kinase